MKPALAKQIYDALLADTTDAVVMGPDEAQALSKQIAQHIVSADYIDDQAEDFDGLKWLGARGYRVDDKGRWYAPGEALPLGGIASLAEHLTAELAEAQSNLSEFVQDFSMRWDADMRAIKRWAAEDPKKRELTWPDHADLGVWLLKRTDQLRETARALVMAWRAGNAVGPVEYFEELERLVALNEDPQPEGELEHDETP